MVKFKFSPVFSVFVLTMVDFRKCGTHGNLRKSFYIKFYQQSFVEESWKNAFVAFAGISHYLEVLCFCAMKHELFFFSFFLYADKTIKLGNNCFFFFYMQIKQ